MPTFEQIRQEYYHFINSMLREGKLPLRETVKGFWGISSCNEVFELFNKLKLNKYNTFLDLGSGDGRVVLIASLFVKKAIGIEGDKELFNISLGIKQKLNAKNADFIYGDYLEHDFRAYDVIYLFPDKHIDLRLKRKFSEELRGISVIFSPLFVDMPLKKEREIMIGDDVITVFSNENEKS